MAKWVRGERAERNREGTWVCPVFSLDDSEKRPCDVYGSTRGQAEARADEIVRAHAEREIQERLLSAAQAVVSDAAICEGDHVSGVHCIDREVLDDLKNVVQEISDQAVEEIEKVTGPRR